MEDNNNVSYRSLEAIQARKQYLLKDIKKDEGYGVIFMINDNNGSILETISCDYDGCDFQPLYNYPNKNGEFDV